MPTREVMNLASHLKHHSPLPSQNCLEPVLGAGEQASVSHHWQETSPDPAEPASRHQHLGIITRWCYNTTEAHKTHFVSERQPYSCSGCTSDSHSFGISFTFRSWRLESQHCSASVSDPCKQPTTALHQMGLRLWCAGLCFPCSAFWHSHNPCAPPGACACFTAASESEKQGYYLSPRPYKGSHEKTLGGCEIAQQQC